MTAKYIKTNNNQIIVFPASMYHTDFRHFEPISAGLIAFGVDAEGNPSCTCYGESVGLNLKSDPDDTVFAKRWILNNRY